MEVQIRTTTDKPVMPKGVQVFVEGKQVYFPTATPQTFEWALIQMKAGKKVTRPGLRWRFYIQTTPGDHEGFIVEEDHLGMVLFADIDQPNLLATDWELVEGEG